MADIEAARAYYNALDDHVYDTFDSLLSPDFTQRRPDRTLESRGEFVDFMENERPLYQTTHDLEEFYTAEGDNELVVRGVLRDEDGEELFEFLDRHVFEGDRIARVQTFILRSD
jgi:ketosteroid isomerase-like protein